MKKVTYRGLAHRAVIREEDWDAVGVSSKEVEWNGYGDEQDVANEAADHLAEKDDRFEVEGAGDDSAYARRRRSDPLEDVRRERTGTRATVGPETPFPGRGSAQKAAQTSSKKKGEDE